MNPLRTPLGLLRGVSPAKQCGPIATPPQMTAVFLMNSRLFI
jgi:hypothetical protein